MIDYNLTDEIETVCVKTVFPGRVNLGNETFRIMINATIVERYCGLKGPDHLDTCKKFFKKKSPMNATCHTCNDDDMCNGGTWLTWRLVMMISAIVMIFYFK